MTQGLGLGWGWGCEPRGSKECLITGAVRRQTPVTVCVGVCVCVIETETLREGERPRVSLCVVYVCVCDRQMDRERKTRGASVSSVHSKLSCTWAGDHLKLHEDSLAISFRNCHDFACLNARE